jgi:hypothetical protein
MINTPDAEASPDYKSGYCQGFTAALEMLRSNRKHYRDLTGQPSMSQEEVLRWIYSRPWLDGTVYRTAPRRIDQPSGRAMIGPPPIESIDLYLIPAIKGCVLSDAGQVTFEMLDWRTET